jgi:hypothetical protein
MSTMFRIRRNRSSDSLCVFGFHAFGPGPSAKLRANLTRENTILTVFLPIDKDFKKAIIAL